MLFINLIHFKKRALILIGLEYVGYVNVKQKKVYPQ